MTALYSLIIVGVASPLLIYSAYLLIDGYRFFCQYQKFSKLKNEFDSMHGIRRSKRRTDVINMIDEKEKEEEEYDEEDDKEDDETET